MQYAIEIGSNCHFQVSQGSVATQLRGCRLQQLCRKFSWESVSKRILKIESIYLPNLWSKVKFVVL